MKTPRSGDWLERFLGGPVMWTGLVLATLFAMGPFFWVLLASVKTRVELYATPITYIPTHPTFQNYVDAWTSKLTPFSTFFANSLWVSSVTMLATIVVSTLAGYALARFRFMGKNTLMLVFLATQMFPAVLLIAPLLSQWHALGLIDTYQALIYSNFSFTVPFTVWMLVGYFESIPRELEESAMIDGSGRFGAMLRIIVPLAAPESPRRPSSPSSRPGASSCLPRPSPPRPTCGPFRPVSCTWSVSTRSSGDSLGPASSSARSRLRSCSRSSRSTSSRA